MELRWVTLPGQQVVALRHVGPFHEIGPKFGQLFQWAVEAGVPIRGALGLWHDDPRSVPEAELRSDACIVVPDGYVLPAGAPEGVRTDTVAGGEYATATHMGPYDGLARAWEEFDGLVGASGRQWDNRPCFEVYVNDCTQVPPEEVRTDLYAAVK